MPSLANWHPEFRESGGCYVLVVMPQTLSNKNSFHRFVLKTFVCRELPLELEGRIGAEDEELEVSVEDMKDEMYVPRKKTFHPFSGKGYRLGR